jgi:DNA-binding SARP family transcriptional activator
MEQAVACALDALSPTTLAQPRPQLRIFALGPVRFYRGERMLKPGDWTYARARELVLFLHSHPNATREQIGVEFWPDASTEQVRKRFSAALAHARNTLGRDIAWITLADGCYRLNPAHVCWSDVQEFEDLLHHGRRLLRANHEEDAAKLLDRAIRLYTGDFAEDMFDAEWTASRRAALRQDYLDALLELGRLHARADRLEQALHCYRQAAEQETCLEEAHCEIIRCYTLLHQRGQALRQYKRLSMALAELGATPSPESRALVERLRCNQPL